MSPWNWEPNEVGGMRFGEYARAGVPIALVTTAIGTAWLVLVR